MKYFVYILCYPDGTPFYVGQGSNDRPQEHIVKAKGGSNSDTSIVIRKILKKGGEVVIQKVFESDDLGRVRDVEKSTIIEYSKKHKLTNRVHAPSKPRQKVVNVRWEIPEDLHWKIATYQKSHSLDSLNVAAVIMLEKITASIKPIEVPSFIGSDL